MRVCDRQVGMEIEQRAVSSHYSLESEWDAWDSLIQLTT